MFDRRFGGLGQILYVMVRLLTVLCRGTAEKRASWDRTQRALGSLGWIA